MKLFGYTIIKTSELEDIKMVRANFQSDVIELLHENSVLKERLSRQSAPTCSSSAQDLMSKIEEATQP